jgi:hypothetical protein
MGWMTEEYGFDIYLIYSIETGSGAHLASYPTGTGVSAWI